ncbi:hypothetical protein HK104_011456 [Borealophlyctis nickersoniae]|nr:hypothetical protein HK104_011456 [Borealophlyctis nickersoniae]
MDPVSRRLLKELRDFQRDPSPQISHLAPVSDDDLFTWRAVIVGPSESPYEGGKFELDIELPKTYPIHPPSIKFVTKICHPNVHLKVQFLILVGLATGEICLDLLKSAWSPAWTLQSACTAIILLLTSPEPNSPLNCDAANLLRFGDNRGYNSLVKMYTELYAGGGGGV